MARIALLTLVSVLFFGGAACADEPVEWTTDLHWGGVGGAYFLASPGEFWVEIERVDLGRIEGKTFLRAILAGPDRRVIDEQTLPDDGRDPGGGPGPVQRVRLSTTVARKGVYALNVTVSNDRYGESTIWGLKTNCPLYLIETSRGHRDAPHAEPLELYSPGAAGDICFSVPPGPFRIKALNSANPAPLTLFNAEDKQAGEVEIAKEFNGQSADQLRPWRLHLPAFSGVVYIDGVTRDAKESAYPFLSLWTPRRESWFPFAAFRWLLTPYSRLAYGPPGAEGRVTLHVSNNGVTPTAVALELEFPDQPWSAELSAKEVMLDAHGSASVEVRYRVPAEGDRWVCHVRATPALFPEFTTFSTVEVRAGTAPADKPLDLPIALTPYNHENEQFGYWPDFPVENEVYFDMENHPSLCTYKGGISWDEGSWTEASADASFSRTSTKVAFDAENWAYAVGQQGGATALAYSADGGKIFKVYKASGTGTCDIEQFSGHNLPQGPPPFVRYNEVYRDPKRIWRRFNDLELFLPKKNDDGSITIPPPILITKKCIGFSGHSGMPSTVVSRDAKVHVIWAEATEPDADAPGVPTYVATYDRDTATMTAPALIGYGPPANDIHNTPCITMDSKGFLHALVGTHGKTFKYARSLEPNNAAGGWTPAEDLGTDLEQTYIGMVCDRNDVLHVAFRLWQYDTNYFPAGNYAALAYMSKRPGEPWSQPRALVTPPFSSYSVYRHRLTIDRLGRLFLSYDYWSTYWFYRNDYPGSRRALLMSPDGGNTWQFAQSRDAIPAAGASGKSAP